MCMVCPSWLSFILYNPIRKALTDRDGILDESGITRDSVVLEVGPGNGFLTEALAERTRRVYALELQDTMVEKLTKRVKRFGDKVCIVKGDISSVLLEEAVCDVCLLYACFHEFGDKPKAAENIARAVRKGGLVSIYEPTLEVGKSDMQKTASLFEERGFVKEAEWDRFFTRFARLRKRP